MTCIVGIVDKDKVIIGGDSAGSDGSHIDERADTKVFRVGDYVMGFTTSFRMGQLLRYALDVPAPESWDVDRFMATTFIDAIRACLKAGGWSKVSEGQEVGGTFLVGVHGRLYAVHDDYQVSSPAGACAAVGSGYLVALGALYATQGQPPAKRVETALNAAAHLNPNVRPPFVVEVTP